MSIHKHNPLYKCYIYTFFTFEEIQLIVFV